MTRVDCETKANVKHFEKLEFGVRGEKELFFGDKKEACMKLISLVR